MTWVPSCHWIRLTLTNSLTISAPSASDIDTSTANTAPLTTSAFRRRLTRASRSR
jgi:hypothetical protein